MSNKVKRPAEPKPDEKLYAHLNEKERMMAGFPYRPSDPQLHKDRTRARKIIRKFNDLDAEDEEGRQQVYDDLFHPDCKGKKLFIESPFRVDYGYNLTFGNNLQLNFDCVFLDCAPITIGDNCLVAPGVHFYAATHPIDAKYRQDNKDYYELAFPIKIGNNCWIGGKSTICPGVTIGDNVVIGAGSVVVKDVLSNVVVAGNPAKIIRDMN